MTTLPNLTLAPEEAAEGESYYTHVPGADPPNRRRPFSSLWRNVLGRTNTATRAFFGATPVAQPFGSQQAAVVATVGAAVAITGATSTTPFGYTTAAQANDLVARVNQLRADILAHEVLLNKMRADLVALGLIKGSA